LQLRIDPNNPARGLYIAGGSNPWLEHDWMGASTTSRPGNSSVHPGETDHFNLNPSNGIDFQIGERVTIFNPAYFQPDDSASVTVSYTAPDSTVNVFNNNVGKLKYKVAEYTTDQINNPLTDGKSFGFYHYNSTVVSGEHHNSGSTSNYYDDRTYGGPLSAHTCGNYNTLGAPLSAWMRLELVPNETVNVQDSSRYDMVLVKSTRNDPSSSVVTPTPTPTCMYGELSCDRYYDPSSNWSSRYNIGGSDQYRYKIDSCLDDSLLICGTYDTHLAVNYKPSMKMYSKMYDSTGEDVIDQSYNIPVTVNESQAFVTKHDSISGEILTCLTTKGTGKSKGYGVAEDSRGRIYMVGSASGDVDFITEYSSHAGSNHGVVTDPNCTWGYLARADKKTILSKQYTPDDTTPEYYWDKVIWVDTKVHELSGTRELRDVVVDYNDDVYVVGYSNSSVEIGTTGAASFDDPTKFAFETGYTWLTGNVDRMFVAKYDTYGMCQWSTVLSGDYIDPESLHMCIDNDDLYVSSSIRGLDTGVSSLSGANIHKVSTTSGNVEWIHHTAISNQCKVNDIEMIEGNGPMITGQFTGTASVPSLIRGDSSTSNIHTVPTGIYVGVDNTGTTQVFGYGESTGESNCITSVTNYQTGNQLILGTTTNDTLFSSQGRTGIVSNNTNKQTAYVITHDTY